MALLFGTDGIRGVANVDLPPSVAHDLARAVVQRLHASEGGAILVGQDTRRSGDMLAAALVAGGTSLGADVHRVGVCPTPALAFLTASGPYAAGIMVSASHNPARDNGLKVFDDQGLKLDEDAEHELATLMAHQAELAHPANEGIGRESDATSRLATYTDHRTAIARHIDCRLQVALDCANGSGSVVAPVILAATGASMAVHFASPDGLNINLDCGATSPDALAAIVAASDADVGFCLDGDADRCVAIDETGTVVDGDQLIGLICLDRLGRDALGGSTVVVSVLSNGGLTETIERGGGRVIRTPVGDRHIHQAMVRSGAGVGGEKSGHVILIERGPMGDGVLTALEVMDIMVRTGSPLSELARRIRLFPQQQRTIAVRHKDGWETDGRLLAAVREVAAELAGRGRVLVRPSGTEAALRIMIEGDDAARISVLADQLSALADERLN